jgi:hypothetical protein
MKYDSHDIQVLRLLKSFFEIHQAEMRETIVRLAEALASGNSTRASSLGQFIEKKPSEFDVN